MKYITTLLLACSFILLGASLPAQDDGGGSFGDSSSASTSAGNGSSSSGVGMVVGENYLLKPSDVISVEIYKEPDLNKSVRVEGEGSVSLALIGKVKIAGMTVAEAQSLITDLYNRDYLVDPQVSVVVVSFSSKVVRILGSVNAPGVVDIPPDRDLTLTEAIAGANGVSRLGNPKSITIKRVDESGRASQMEVNFSRILTDPNVKDIILQEGDTIWVPERII
ncbi:MAG: polysaccharide biosynthesis/export family protein [Opitutales bacterium]|jgi:polysaccharide biosynthesis/export protein|nr:polysaccharide biosynthesis/export family protein [Opitutales bacterium]MDP4643967.1 polysaccharide biosynthesis/export family protein [Opitutales bacterium]MDP4777637.1 polysaccharide biosynthesis/export family protein [Opitutales bacterium]MDP4883144.1 polysaccharide biosynthesis/export family protein [Opitutales bacterium]MDP5079260.1 polysaccharide biosynthesis/export family protein [Opitutales bacterium]